ncbi:MAG: thiamine pyrophosphate-binding protein [Desulfatiglandales bacterium]|jgi:acetolactate synthase-1/2/3 large subunit|nr:thiamine pyrophosphate-binding protein [Desulfatiglandales bacterium]
MSKMTGSQFISETFKGYGVKHLFVMPYVLNQVMRDSEKLGLRSIMCHSEKGAAYMADAYARISRRPSVCMAQSVGAANLAAGLQDAYLACSPVIALTGRLQQIKQQRNAYQEINHSGPFSSVTKYDGLVTSAKELPFFLRQAFREATSATPGPAHLDFYGIDGSFVANDTAELEVVIEEPFSRIPPFRPEPEISLVLEALKLLAQAERPLILAGGGVTASGAENELLELAEKLSIPVATALNAKTSIPWDHPLSVGVPGAYSRECSNKIVCQADLVFFIGSHTGGQVTHDWRIPPAGTDVIQLDINPAELGRSYPIKLGMQGDAKASLRKMIEQAGNSSPGKQWLSSVKKQVSDWREEVSQYVDSEEIPMRPERLCRELSDSMPSDAVLISDTGHSGVWTGSMVDFKHPGQSFLRCAGSLGWGIPATIGAKCAAPDRPVVCFTGDGGVYYHLTELDTALRFGINPVIVVNNNSSLNQEQGGVEGTYGGRSSLTDEKWILSELDFDKVAESIGCFGIQVRKPSEFEGALDQALQSGKPALIDVKTHIESIAPGAWLPNN